MAQTADGHSEEIDALALDLTRITGRFSRIAGRTSSGYSLIAWRVLAELEQTGAARVSALAHQQRVAQPSMTGLIGRLEGEGWVARSADPDDGRAALIEITGDGARALDAYRSAAAARVRPGLETLADFDRAVLARAAEILHHISEEIEHDD